MNPLQTAYPEGYSWTTLTYLTCGTNWESGTFNIKKIILAVPDSSFCGTAESCFEIIIMVLGDALVVWVLCLLL